jgi:ABC-2 type transport system ATP-binding protein
MAEMRVLIRRLGDEGKAILLSSHQLGEVQQICDRVGIIFKGRLATESTVQELRGAAGLVVVATPRPSAEACLVDLLGPAKVTVRDEELRLDAGPEHAASIARALVGAGIDVHELRRDERSLEEVFLAMSAAYEGETGGRHAAA